MPSEHCRELLAMKPITPLPAHSIDRRAFLAKAIAASGVSTVAALNLAAADAPTKAGSGDDYLKELEEEERTRRSKDAKPMIGVGGKLKITKVETFLVKPRWLPGCTSPRPFPIFSARNR